MLCHNIQNDVYDTVSCYSGPGDPEDTGQTQSWRGRKAARTRHASAERGTGGRVMRGAVDKDVPCRGNSMCGTVRK